MSWLARSIANTLPLEDEDDPASMPPEDRLRDGVLIPEEDSRSADSDDDRSYDSYRVDDGDRDGEDHNDQGPGVREDLSELKDTLTRQFWGVASFLAPPPPPPPPRPVQKSVLVRSESKSDWAESDHDYEDEDEELVEYDLGHYGQFGGFSNLSRSEDFNYTTKPLMMQLELRRKCWLFRGTLRIIQRPGWISPYQRKKNLMILIHLMHSTSIHWLSNKKHQD